MPWGGGLTHLSCKKIEVKSCPEDEQGTLKIRKITQGPFLDSAYVYWIHVSYLKGGFYLTIPKVFMKLRMVSISEFTQAGSLSGPI
jgi:hypothetical protein